MTYRATPPLGRRHEKQGHSTNLQGDSLSDTATNGGQEEGDCGGEYKSSTKHEYVYH